MTNFVKVSDYIAKFLADSGLTHVFMLTGGGAMHLNDSFGKQAGLQIICNHHEQASAMAAESYARLSGKMAIVNVTTGPGGINTLNGVFGAYVDSIPMLIVSGQVRYDTTVDSSGLPLRQLGDQECDIVKIVQGITKYAVMIKNAADIKFHLQKALYTATQGRPGPAWLDVPMNVQGSLVDPESLRSFTPEEAPVLAVKKSDLDTVIEQLKAANRPVILAGSAIRQSGSHHIFMTLIEKLNIPVVTAWNAHDVLYDSHELHAGKPGSIGDRAGNFAVQNSDCLLVLGCRLNLRQVSYNWKSFAKQAYKMMVDIDEYELQKPTLNINLPIHADIKAFMQQLLGKLELDKQLLFNNAQWIEQCEQWKQRYPVVLDSYWKEKQVINPYCFMKTLGELLPPDQIIVSGDGTACVVGFQAIELKVGQRFYTNSGCASMGYDLPGAIGACIASGNKKIICLAGDGSIQQNIQELATIQYHQYPIKIFVLNNNGYHSIRQTQHNYFPGDQVGVGPESGLGFPSFEKLAYAYDLQYFKCDSQTTMADIISRAIEGDRPILCEIMIDLHQEFAPKIASRRLENGTMVSSELEDMAPFLSREELETNLYCDPAGRHK